MSATEPRGPMDGVQAFLSRWEINDLLFMVVFENLRLREPEAEPWLAITPRSVRQGVGDWGSAWLRHFGYQSTNARVAFLLAQGLVGLTLAGLCLWLSLRPWGEDPRHALLENTFLTLAWLWYLSATQNPWYWTWALPFVVFARRRIWWLTSGLALLYYLRFWFIYQLGETAILGTGLMGMGFFDYVVVWLEHLPVLLGLAWLGARDWLARRQTKRPAVVPAS